ncbi:hypothetical protein [Marixanthomonas ophiurae]|nr:hypothetical protein [Marixanthomonas ophiurae]
MKNKEKKLPKNPKWDFGHRTVIYRDPTEKQEIEKENKKDLPSKK